MAAGVIVAGSAVLAPVVGAAVTQDGSTPALDTARSSPAATVDAVGTVEAVATTELPTRSERQPATVLATGDDEPVLVRVRLWGDSLAWESRDEFLRAFAGDSGYAVDSQTFGGTAICDYLDSIRASASQIDLAVLEFSGNSLYACMVDPASGSHLRGPDLVARYEQDVRAAIEALGAHEVRVVLAGAPDVRDESADGERHSVRALYERVAADYEHVVFVDTGSALRGDDGYTDRLPCLDFEDASLGCEDGSILVRSPDGLHLCAHPDSVTDGMIGRCGVWSSGAHRYGNALADAARAAATDIVASV